MPNSSFTRRRLVSAMALACAGLALPQGRARAQGSYPTKPIRLVVPFPAGGITDVTGRIIADALSRRLGQQVFVDNRSGASGNIGTQFAAVAEPDGYTLMIVPDSNVLITPHVYKDLPYDPIKDFVTVGKIGDTALVIIANAHGPIKSLSDVLALAKSRPEGLSYGTSGVGSNSHIVGEFLRQRTGANLVHIPYKGGGPAISDLLGNQVPIVITAVTGAMQHLKSGTLIAIAVPTPQRIPSLPDVPTFVESGVPNLVYNSWIALFAPVRTPRPIVEHLTAELNSALAQADVRERLAGVGIVATPTSPAAFSAEIRRDFEQIGPLIRKANITAE